MDGGDAKMSDKIDDAFNIEVEDYLKMLNTDRPWWVFGKYELSHRERATAKLFFMKGLLWQAKEMRKILEGKDGRGNKRTAK